MQTSRLRLFLFLSAFLHVLVLGLLRFISLSESPAPAASISDAPVAVRLLELPPPRAQVPERARKLPDAPTRKPESVAPKSAPPPRVPESATPKLATPPPPKKGGTVVDLPKPVREERPDDAQLISRYDSKAQDIGPGEGGTRKPSGERPRVMPPDIPLPERYSTGQRTPPEAPLEASEPPVPTPPSVTPATPKAPGPPPVKAESPPLKPPAPTLKSEVLTPPKPPAPAPQARPAPPARPTPPAAPRTLAEEKRRPETPSSSRSAQAKAAPPAPESPRAPAREKRRAEAPPSAGASQTKTALAQSATPQTQPEAQRQGEAPASAGATRPAPNRALTPEEQRRYRLTAQQELAMLQSSAQEREGTGKASGNGKQSLDEHFARLEKHLPLELSFDAPGVFERGPERSGEGRGNGEGGKYRSIASFGFKHVSYLLGMQRKIELVFTVPPFVPDHGAVGVPVVGFTVRRSGELAEAVVLHSSGYPAVDQALIRAVKRAAPYHPFPNDMPDQEISIRIYASFS